MNEMNLLSIIVPVYKVEQYLPKCIESILQQQYSAFELILVDDGSPDTCGEICDNYAEKDKRIKVIHQINKGPSGARNAGIAVASGRYVGFVDGDDYISASMYALLVESLEQNKSDMAMCGWYTTFPNKQIACCSNGSNQVLRGEEKFAAVALNNAYMGFACNKLFCMNILEKHKLQFDEKVYLMEDLLFVCKYLKYCNSISTVANPLYFYVQRSDSLIHKPVLLKNIYAKVNMRNEVLAILQEENCQRIIIEEKTYQCLDAAEGVCIAQDYKDNAAEKFFTEIFSRNYDFIRQSRTITKVGILKCRAMRCNKWLYRLLRKSYTIFKVCCRGFINHKKWSNNAHKKHTYEPIRRPYWPGIGYYSQYGGAHDICTPVKC